MRKIYGYTILAVLILSFAASKVHADKLVYNPFYEAVKNISINWRIVSMGYPMEAELSLRNDSNEYLNLSIPVGMRLKSSAPGDTDLIVGRSEAFSVAPHYEKKIRLVTFGLDPRKKSPPSGNVMNIELMSPSGGKIDELLKNSSKDRPSSLDVPDFLDYPTQAAVWKLTTPMDLQMMKDFFAPFVHPKDLQYSAGTYWRKSSLMLEKIGIEEGEVIAKSSGGELFKTSWDFMDLTRKR
ncbi:MAG: hypothetical protein M1269_09230 [Chloroflexi bacterium]|nr:hypothetical protein [Chloroflexota bacterium]